MMDLQVFGHILAQEPQPAPGIMKFVILVDLSIVIITMHSFCLNHVQE